MALCECQERPRCEYHYCGKPADWSIFTPPGRWLKTWPKGRLHFMCASCRDYYNEALSKPLKGIDRPEGADEDWRPSIMEHLRHSRIAIEFEERDKKRVAEREPNLLRYVDLTRFTPAQLEQVVIHRKLMAKFRPAPGSDANG